MSNIAQNQNITYTQKVIDKSLLPKSLKVIEKSLFKVIGSRYLKSRYQQIVGESAFLLSIRHLRVCQQIVGESEIYRQIVRLDIYFIFSLQSR